MIAGQDMKAVRIYLYSTTLDLCRYNFIMFILIAILSYMFHSQTSSTDSFFNSQKCGIMKGCPVLQIWHWCLYIWWNFYLKLNDKTEHS